MKMIIVVALALVAAAAAAPTGDQEEVHVVEISFEQTPEGGFHRSYKTSDGIEQEETGVLREVPGEDGELKKVIVVSGHYNQFDENGQPQTISYEANENGYKASGPLIPKIPEPTQ